MVPGRWGRVDYIELYTAYLLCDPTKNSVQAFPRSLLYCYGQLLMVETFYIGFAFHVASECATSCGSSAVLFVGTSLL